jgi:bifunctional non-homologous end joining protein LigD
VPGAHVGDGAALRDAAKAQGIDALIAKRTTSTYRPGEQSEDWLRVTV